MNDRQATDAARAVVDKIVEKLNISDTAHQLKLDLIVIVKSELLSRFAPTQPAGG